MNLEKDALTLEKLCCRISEYKQTKPDNSAKSIGTTFETSNNIYFLILEQVRFLKWTGGCRSSCLPYYSRIAVCLI